MVLMSWFLLLTGRVWFSNQSNQARHWGKRRWLVVGSMFQEGRGKRFSDWLVLGHRELISKFSLAKVLPSTYNVDAWSNVREPVRKVTFSSTEVSSEAIFCPFQHHQNGGHWGYTTAASAASRATEPAYWDSTATAWALAAASNPFPSAYNPVNPWPLSSSPNLTSNRLVISSNSPAPRPYISVGSICVDCTYFDPSTPTWYL